VPEDTITRTRNRVATVITSIAARLAEQGFIVYRAAQSVSRQDKFSRATRKANPLGLSLFSFIIAQHEVATDWLRRFHSSIRSASHLGLSYGGKTRCACRQSWSGIVFQFARLLNEWVRSASRRSPLQLHVHREYECRSGTSATRSTYAEMASLIAPRPFMVERGHDDGGRAARGSLTNTRRFAACTTSSARRPHGDRILQSARIPSMAWAHSSFWRSI